MTETIGAMEPLMEDANKFEKALFNEVQLILKHIKDNKKCMLEKFNQLESAQTVRCSECSKIFITKRQAKIFGIVTLVGTMGYLLGARIITYQQVLKALTLKMLG